VDLGFTRFSEDLRSCAKEGEVTFIRLDPALGWETKHKGSSRHLIGLSRTTARTNVYVPAFGLLWGSILWPGLLLINKVYGYLESMLPSMDLQKSVLGGDSKLALSPGSTATMRISIERKMSRLRATHTDKSTQQRSYRNRTRAHRQQIRRICRALRTGWNPPTPHAWLWDAGVAPQPDCLSGVLLLRQRGPKQRTRSPTFPGFINSECPPMKPNHLGRAAKGDGSLLLLRRNSRRCNHLHQRK